MNATVETIIADLRHALSAPTDAALARKLRIDKSTISSWRSRGRVPEKFQSMIENGAVAAVEHPDVWGELQERANAVALLRFTLLRADLARQGGSDRALPVFRDMRPFWLILNRVVVEMRSKLETLGVDLDTAQALLMHDDLRDPLATAGRVSSDLNQDLADNGWLASWKPEQNEV